MAKLLEILRDNKDVKDLTNSVKNGFHVSTIDGRSIAAQASAATYMFPVLVSNSIDPEKSSKIIDNLELQYCQFVKACFALKPAMKVNDASKMLSIEDYLKEFHQNIGIKSKKDLVIHVNESAEYKMFPNSPLNESSNENKKELNEAVYGTAYKQAGEDTTSVGNLYVESKIDNDEKFNKNMSYNLKDQEKRNPIAATPVEVPVNFIFGGKLIETKVTVGVKAMAHGIQSSDLVKQIVHAITKKGMINGLIRWRSGELNSLKDIIFHTDDMKRGIGGASEAAKWFNIIEHRKRLNKLSLGLLAKKPFLPNISIMLSSDEVNDIARQTGIDLLTNSEYAAKFMDDNYLISLIIYNAGLDTVYIMNDGMTYYNEIPFASLKRSNSKAEDEISKIMKSLIS